MKNKKRFAAGFIGCGNMGGALAAVAAKAAGKDMIAVCDTDASTCGCISNLARQREPSTFNIIRECACTVNIYLIN